MWTTTGPGERVTAVAVSPSNDQVLLAAGETGVWQTLDGGGSWTQVSPVQLRQGLSIATGPNTVYGVSSDARSLLKSTDGGGTWTSVYNGAGQTQFYTVLADPTTSGLVYGGGSYTDGLAQVLRSTDAGATWAPVLPASLRGAGGIGTTSITTLAAIPGLVGLVLAGIQVYHGGGVLRSTDSGATWSSAYSGNLTPLAGASALAAAGESVGGATIYAGVNVMQFGSLVCSQDGGGSWANLSPALPIHGTDGGYIASLLTNPGQPVWAYLAQWNTALTPQTGVFATPDAGASWVEIDHLDAQVHGPQGLALAIPSHTLYAATDTGVYQSAISWPVLSRFAAYYDAGDGLRVLGTAISLATTVDGYVSQYFEKGRLEDHTGESADPAWQFMYGLLVDELQSSLAPLPIGGESSTMTYADLHGLADPSQRGTPPPGYSGSSTMTIDAEGTTFIPFSADLTGAPGYLVPGRFWEYMNGTEGCPGGWLHDLGLPISPAQQLVVTKALPDGPEQRTIIMQAFQRAILTDDPQNPSDWRIERANVGSDYRKFFPARVGP